MAELTSDVHFPSLELEADRSVDSLGFHDPHYNQLLNMSSSQLFDYNHHFELSNEQILGIFSNEGNQSEPPPGVNVISPTLSSSPTLVRNKLVRSYIV
jgi:hypothetical protein